LIYKGKKYFGGFFENEEHAAMKVNLLCEKLGIQRKNPTIDIELDEIHQQFKNQTSTYTDVCWMKDKKRWRAQLTNNQMIYYGGCFKSEEHAAMKVNSLCDELEIGRKNPMIIKKADKIQENFKNQTSSKYTGVSWHENRKKWRAQLAYNHKKYNGGYFDKEEDAAMSINLLCDKYEVERKNPTIDIKLFEPYQAQILSSQYNAVYWNEDKKRWQVQLTYNKKRFFGGLFDNEKHAAMKVNLLCDKLGIQRKNPMIDIEFDVIPQVHNSTSQYTYVHWDNTKKKWRARLPHNEKKSCGGYFDNEEHAAMKVNLLCDELGIERKNPMVDIKFDEIRQKTKSNQPKAENIVNEQEVKVEEENTLYGLKDQCENNFIKKSCQNQKRKRKEDSILNDVIGEHMVNTTPDPDQNEVFEEIQKDYIKTLDYTIPKEYHFNQF